MIYDEEVESEMFKLNISDSTSQDLKSCLSTLSNPRSTGSATSKRFLNRQKKGSGDLAFQAPSKAHFVQRKNSNCCRSVIFNHERIFIEETNLRLYHYDRSAEVSCRAVQFEGSRGKAEHARV